MFTIGIRILKLIADIKIPAIITDNSLYMCSIAGILLHKQKRLEITLFQTTKIVIILYYIPDLLR